MTGRVYIVEAALRTDGSSPAGDILRRMREGAWDADPDHTSTPDDEQISDYHKIMAIVRRFANFGTVTHRTSVNYLRNGIWEFKVARKRLTFFDTPGDGTFTPKDTRDISMAHPSFNLPHFDDIIRIGHIFGKHAQKTSQIDLCLAETTRREDLEHDARTAREHV